MTPRGDGAHRLRRLTPGTANPQSSTSAPKTHRVAPLLGEPPPPPPASHVPSHQPPISFHPNNSHHFKELISLRHLTLQTFPGGTSPLSRCPMPRSPADGQA